MRLMITLTSLAALSLSAPHSAYAQSTDNSTAKNLLIGGALIGGTLLTIDALKHKHHKHHDRDEPPMIPLAPGPVIFPHPIGNGAVPNQPPLPPVGSGVRPSNQPSIGEGVIPNGRGPLRSANPSDYNPYK